ncbi:DUF3060 domain-containing protein [Mycolicibacterium flavescens]|uniref:Transmembrane protein n=1 Tax=Mycolicibacterium flavescens TaxID=1776 RepID=A0A1E3RLK6_MYCFV|nr:DUF3060 domain-containing protein [Mycolicibacterium flavescens]MCV7281858.1 DUF3060 domain-containing protein [Mycolicibacterium flavescens]ODQ90766.1 hypothetical protein BHQ18_08500 [Mycolicibacterium flavescens]
MTWTVVARSLAASAIVIPLAGVAPSAQAEPVICNPVLRQCADNSVVGSERGTDTHITGIGIVDTIDCKNSTLLVNGANNQITALGTCWAVTMQGNGNIVVADNVINDVTVYGWDQQVLYKNGNPAVVDRGRELGMTNRIDRVPA